VNEEKKEKAGVPSSEKEEIIWALLIDDNPDDRQLVLRELQKSFPRIKVQEIIDEQGFTAALNQGKFDLVITDYKLRWITGLEVLQRVKEKYPYCAVVMFTATGSEEIAVEAMKEGLDEYVLKSAKHFVRLPVAVRAALTKEMQRKKVDEMQKRLEESETKYRSLTENINDIIYAVNQEGVITYISPQVKRLGFSPEEFIGKSLSEIARNILEEDRERMLSDFAKVLQNGQERPTEYRFVSRDGSVHWLEDFGRVQYDQNGRPTGIISVLRDITKEKEAYEKLQQSLREKEVLLREIHHRVKNNMQIMASLLRLQARQAEDEKTMELFRESQARIRTMALVHERLYQSQDFSQIDFSDYIQHMALHLMSLYHERSKNVDLEIKSEGVKLDINKAIPCALLLNEIITNALKHAFPEAQPGKLGIVFEKKPEGKYSLQVKDNGIGLPLEINLAKPETLGLQLITDLAFQLGGELKIYRNGGTTYELTFS